MKLIDAFKIRSGDVITFVGAGGKSSAMYALAKELKEKGEKVLVTTTTKIFYPKPSESDKIYLSEDYGETFKFLSKESLPGNIITIGSGVKNNKIIGISPETVCKIKKNFKVTILVEGDGSKRKPFKAPSEFEPVVPKCTELVIPVVGLDILGKKLSEENTHRLEQVEKITHLKKGDIVDIKSIKEVLLNPNSYLKDMTIKKAKYIPLLNKLDLVEDTKTLEKLVELLFKNEKIKCVVGSSFLKGTQNIIKWEK